MQAEQSQQLSPSSTDPRPPTGQTPTQPPLSSSSTVGTTPVEIKNQIDSINIGQFLLMEPFQISDMNISAESLPETIIYQWEFDRLFKFASNQYKYIYQMIPLLFSTQFHVELELIFQPIKVGDSIVTVDYLWSYDGKLNNTTDPDMWQGDWQELVFENSEPISIKVPLYWLMDMIPTQVKDPPHFRPRTKLVVKIKNQYSPPPIHPDSFKILVFMKFNKCLATETRVMQMDDIVPWFTFFDKD